MTNDELIARAEANIAAHEKTGNGDLQRVKDMAALVAALKASEARVNDLLEAAINYREEIDQLQKDAIKDKARAKELEEALIDHNDLLRSAFQIADREGVKMLVATTNWDAFYNKVAITLKRHHQITNEVRAVLKGGAE